MKKPLRKNRLEWTVFAVSLVIVGAVLGRLVVDGASMSERRPWIKVELGSPEAQGSIFVVPVTVTNAGDETAAALRIEVTLEGAFGEERGEVDIALLPRQGAGGAEVTFIHDPAQGRLTARVLGYERP